MARSKEKQVSETFISVESLPINTFTRVAQRPQIYCYRACAARLRDGTADNGWSDVETFSLK